MPVFLHLFLLPRFWGGINFLLLFLDELDELSHVSNWIQYSLIILFAACAIDILVFLASQVLDDSLQFWRKISLTSVEFKWLDVFTKFAQFDFSKLLFLFPFLCFVLLVFFFQINQVLLVISELVLQDFVDNLEFRDFVHIIVHQAF